MTLPEETVLELVTKVTNLKCDLEEMTKDAEYLKTTRNIQYAVCKLAKLNWQTCLEKFWDNEEEAEEELSQFIGDVRRGVPGERLRKYIESKLQDPSQRALPTVLQEDPVSFLKSGKTMELCPDTVVFNEEVSEWQQLLRAVMDLPTLQEEHCIIISTSWETVSDIKKSVELMFPSKAVAVIVHHNKKGNYTQPFVALATRNRRALPVLIEGNTRDTLFEKLFTNAQGSLLVMHCGKGEALKAGLKRGLQVMGIDPRKEMIRSCSRFLQ